MQDHEWKIVDTIVGVIAGVVGSVLAMLGWLQPKFAKVERETDQLRESVDDRMNSLHERVTKNLGEITRLAAHREDDLRRLEGIDKKLDRILDRIPNNVKHEGDK